MDGCKKSIPFRENGERSIYITLGGKANKK